MNFIKIQTDKDCVSFINLEGLERVDEITDGYGLKTLHLHFRAGFEQMVFDEKTNRYYNEIRKKILEAISCGNG